MDFKQIKIGDNQEVIVYGESVNEFHIKVKFYWDSTNTIIKKADVKVLNSKQDEYELYIDQQKGYEGAHICVDPISKGLFAHVFEIYLVDVIGKPTKLDTSIRPAQSMIMKPNGSYIFVNIISHEQNEEIDNCKSFVTEQEFNSHPNSTKGAIIVSI